MTTVTLAGTDYTLEPTGLKHVAYTLTSAKAIRKGIRAPHNPDIILVLDRSSRYCGAFRDSTKREVTRRTKGEKDGR